MSSYSNSGNAAVSGALLKQIVKQKRDNHVRVMEAAKQRGIELQATVNLSDAEKCAFLQLLIEQLVPEHSFMWLEQYDKKTGQSSPASLRRVYRTHKDGMPNPNYGRFYLGNDDGYSQAFEWMSDSAWMNLVGKQYLRSKMATFLSQVHFNEGELWPTWCDGLFADARPMDVLSAAIVAPRIELGAQPLPEDNDDLTESPQRARAVSFVPETPRKPKRPAGY